MKNVVLWDVTPRGSWKNTDISFLRSVLRLLITANDPSSPILVTLMMEAIFFLETSVFTRATQRNISEYDILYNYNYLIYEIEKKFRTFRSKSRRTRGKIETVLGYTL
jgi:hypothetical protein